MSNNDDCRYNLSPLLASRSAWHHHEQKDGLPSVRAREFIDLHRQSGEHESECRDRAGAAARSEEKIEEECTLYYMVNFIIGTRASAVTTMGRIIAWRLA